MAEEVDEIGNHFEQAADCSGATLIGVDGEGGILADQGARGGEGRELQPGAGENESK